MPVAVMLYITVTLSPTFGSALTLVEASRASSHFFFPFSTTILLGETSSTSRPTRPTTTSISTRCRSEPIDTGGSLLEVLGEGVDAPEQTRRRVLLAAHSRSPLR